MAKAKTKAPATEIRDLKHELRESKYAVSVLKAQKLDFARRIHELDAELKYVRKDNERLEQLVTIARELAAARCCPE